jgi:hypothetical protein
MERVFCFTASKRQLERPIESIVFSFQLRISHVPPRSRSRVTCFAAMCLLLFAAYPFH